MAGKTLMQYPAVDSMANVFNTTGDVLNTVYQALEIAIAAAQAAAFISLGATEAFVVWGQNVAPKLKKLAQDSHEVSNDLKAAIKFYRDGDTSGSSRFR